jgi:hypothetical protein
VPGVEQYAGPHEFVSFFFQHFSSFLSGQSQVGISFLSPAWVKESRETVSVFSPVMTLDMLVPDLSEASMNTSKDTQKGTVPNALKLRFLSASQLKKIDEVLSELGEYGEVRLVVQHGELRYINKMESFKVRKNETNQ